MTRDKDMAQVNMQRRVCCLIMAPAVHHSDDLLYGAIHDGPYITRIGLEASGQHWRHAADGMLSQCGYGLS
jgi:hypothetical protein